MLYAASHRLADAAKTGDWSTVFDLLDDPDQLVDINWWRPGGPAWFTVLHQAAWHGAPTEVAAELIRRGALRSLRDSRGRTAHDIRCQRDLTVGQTQRGCRTAAQIAGTARTVPEATALLP